MKFDLKRPCKSCPFRTDIPPFLSRRRGVEIANSIDGRKLQQTFPCHMTTVDDEDEDCGERHVTPNSQHCAGAMIVLEHEGAPNQMMRIAERLGLYDRSKLEMDQPVFKTLKEFVKAQR